ncbi:MAG: outer membrane lipoprotein carrier protein LolA [Lentimicrobiaceae bacterium]|nr:outer membrane lipoprotein carrier protein LolA [Lentimicrobiaceae bacterium]MCB9023717.1 outer membrane lipoprotein carrier protein LolA [Lentimicrobiaceae bacterium]MCO5266250.1 outer membrane lipoprotein carrier protein LolA [Lentimicrobium sp.]HPG32694.1 outer membrane lipoprotein carrier protein LolA [Lentimicrobium sp.]
MKKIIFSTFALIFAFSSMAQSDKKARTILDEVSAKTKTYKTIRIEFAYNMENKAQKINDTYKGVLISKGDKYKLSFSGQDVISDGKTAWTFVKDANEVQINNVSKDDDSFTPTNLLSTYNENYKAKLLQETAKQQIIELTPIKKKNFNKVKITIERAKKMVSSISIFDKNGSVYTYSVNKFETDLPFNDNTFVFKAAEHPGVETVDMR